MDGAAPNAKVITVSVIHTFTFDSTNAVRNRYQTALDLGHDKDSAAVALWQKFCMSIKGYQGVPKDFKPYFVSNEQGREHAVSAVNFLLDQISFQKVELRQRQGQ